MEKELLQNEEGFKVMQSHLQSYDRFSVRNPPTKYPCLLVYEILDDPQGFRVIYEYIYLEDFQQ
jgi:hypothetical protein